MIFCSSFPLLLLISFIITNSTSSTLPSVIEFSKWYLSTIVSENLDLNRNRIKTELELMENLINLNYIQIKNFASRDNPDTEQISYGIENHRAEAPVAWRDSFRNATEGSEKSLWKSLHNSGKG